MGTPEEELVDLTDLWNTGDVDEWYDRMGRYLAFRPDPSFPDSNWMRGEALREWVREWSATWKGNRLEMVERPFRHGHAFVVPCRWHLTALGSESEVPVADFSIVFWRDEEQWRRMAALFDHDQALAIAEVPEDEVERRL